MISGPHFAVNRVFQYYFSQRAREISAPNNISLPHAGRAWSPNLAQTYLVVQIKRLVPDRRCSDGRGSRAACSPPTPCGSSFMPSPIISATSCARWRRPSRSKIGRLNEPEGEAGQDRCEDRQPWSLCRFPDGRSRHSENSLCRHPAADRGVAAAARYIDWVMRSVTRSTKNHGRRAS